MERRRKMNAIRILLKDHEEIGKLLHQFVEAGEEAYQQKQTIAEKVIEQITNHARLEDEILFPALKKKGGEEGEEMATEAVEEHDLTRYLLNRLKKTRAEDKKFDARFKILMENLHMHFLEEEREIFPKAKKTLKGELEKMGKEMEALKKQMKQ
jgi:hemerythrin-like domain-containing protein